MSLRNPPSQHTLTLNRTLPPDHRPASSLTVVPAALAVGISR